MQVRGIGDWHFEDGGILSLKIIGKTPMKDALDMAQTLIDLKRKELEASQAFLNTPSEEGCADAKAGGRLGSPVTQDV